MLKVRVSVSLAWWWPLYKYGLIFFCVLMLARPDMDKVERMAHRAVRIKLR